MIYKYILITVAILTLSSCKNEKKDNSENEETTSHYYFIRHAEKERLNPDDDNPKLTSEGKLRAENWSIILDHIKFDAVYSTNYTRTLETAKPTATKNNLEITIYKPNELDIKSFLKDTEGKNILIVGHSNSTPKLVNRIIKKEEYEDINDYTFGNLYHVTITNSKILNYELTTNH